MAWARRAANAPGPLQGGSPNPGGGPGVQVEMWIGWWEDITAHVYYRDMIKITRGRTDESSQVQPQQCAFTLANLDGRFSPNNPVGPYYGLIGRNTPIRVSTWWNGVQSFRFFGELAAWPTTWDASGTDVYAQVEADGILRRLGQTQLPLKSTMARSMPLQSIANGGPVAAYWSCEDAVSATVIAAGMPGVKPMSISGQPTLASFSSWPGSDALPVLANSGAFIGTVPSYDPGSSTFAEVRMFVQVSSAVPSNQRLLSFKTTGSAAQFDLILTTGGDLILNIYDAGGNLLSTGGGGGAFDLNTGTWNIVGIQIFDLGGGNVDADASVTQFSANSLFDTLSTANTGASLTGQTYGIVKQVTIGGGSGLGNVTVGQVYVAKDLNNFTNTLPAAAGYNGEPAVTRLRRLCSEQGIPLLIPSGVSKSNAAMGWQTLETFLTLLQECVDADTGLLYEPADRPGLAYVPLQALYNQPSSLAIDYAQNHLSEPPIPTDDDRFIVNDVSVQRTDGSTAELSLAAGSMSTQAPPAGIGTYDTQVTLNLAGDGYIGERPDAGVLTDHAGWRLHVGTTSSSRYPAIALNIRRLAAVGASLTPALIQAVDIGERITIDNPPPWLPPDQISQIVQGYTETIGAFEHDITLNTSPELPYRPAVAGGAHADTDGSALAAGVDAVTGTLQVATTNASSPIWTTTPADLPFDVNVGGERVTVTAISGASSPQTFTVTRSVNTVVKAHPAGEQVSLWNTPILGL